MARSAHVGLLTSIFGNRDDGASGAGKSSESVEDNQMREPDDRTPSHGPDAPAGTGKAEFAAGSGSEAPLVEDSETEGPGQAESALRRRRTGKVSIDPAARSAARPVETGTSKAPMKSAPVKAADATSRAGAATMQPPARHPEPQALEGRRSGGVWTQGAPIARDTPMSTRVHAASDEGTHFRMAPADAQDPDEIDVSDQLDEFAEPDTSGDLAYEDLIIEDEKSVEDDEDEDEDTSISVSVWGASGAARGARAPLAGAPRSDGESHAADARASQQKSEEDSSGFAAPRLGSEPAQPSPGQTARIEPAGTQATGETQAIKQTLVEAGTVLEGTLKSSYPVVVNGTIDGEIDAPTLSIGSSGVIVGVIRSTTLRSQGTVSGRIDAGEVFLSGIIVERTVVKARRLELKLASSEKGLVNVTFATGNDEPTDVGSELHPSGALDASAAGHDKDGTSAR
jgi:cytoskeletal protein CcmA (bactofilin family)